jgi:hypothetical protein
VRGGASAKPSREGGGRCARSPGQGGGNARSVLPLWHLHRQLLRPPPTVPAAAALQPRCLAGTGAAPCSSPCVPIASPASPYGPLFLPAPWLPRALTEGPTSAGSLTTPPLRILGGAFCSLVLVPHVAGAGRPNGWMPPPERLGAMKVVTP